MPFNRVITLSKTLSLKSIRKMDISAVVCNTTPMWIIYYLYGPPLNTQDNIYSKECQQNTNTNGWIFGSDDATGNTVYIAFILVYDQIKRMDIGLPSLGWVCSENKQIKAWQ